MTAPFPAAETAPPTHFAHPRARHHSTLQGVRVEFALRRSKTRSSTLMRVDSHGLTVTAPASHSLSLIEQTLHSRADWILAQLRQQHQRQLAAPAPAWGDGMLLPYLGRPITLRHDLRQRHGPGQAMLLDDELHIGLPARPDASQWRQATLDWLTGQARRHFTRRLDHFAPQMGVQWKSMRLTSARTLWGSASHNASIRLHWRLMHLHEDLIDYVVVHELAHLHEMNHSPRFWRHVQAILPDYRQRRQRLKSATPPFI